MTKSLVNTNEVALLPKANPKGSNNRKKIKVDCPGYEGYQSESYFLKNNQGKVLWVNLYLENDHEKFAVQLFLSKNLNPRVLTMTLFKREGDSEESEEMFPVDLPIAWRHLSGSDLKSVKDYFANKFSITNSSIAFEEYAGSGGKKILWEENSGITSCTQ